MNTKCLLFAGLLAAITFNAFGKGGTNSVVFAAAAQEDVAQLQQIFAQNTNLLSLRDDLLRAAVMNGQKNSMEYLIAQGANVDAKGFFDMTPLANMAMYGRADDEKCAEIAAVLLSHGAHVDPVDQYGGTPLIHATEMKKIKLMRVLLEHGANPAYTNGFTPLQYAMREMNIEMIKLLLDFKAPIVGNGDYDNRTPSLMCAINRQNYEVTRLLLEHGATITPPRTVPGLRNNSWQYWPLENENRELTPLLWATFRRDHKMLALLLEFKAPLNAVDHNGRTPLHYAVEFGDVDMTKLLLDAKADATIVDYDGATPLFLAEAAENKTMADLLRRASASASMSGLDATIPSREIMRSLAQRICDGDTAAFNEFAMQVGAMSFTNRPSESRRNVIWDRLHFAAVVLGEAAGKGNANAMQALKKFLNDGTLKHFALEQLGMAAAVGNAEALDLLLHGQRQYGFLENSICFAIEPAAKSNQPPAVNYFVDLALDPKTAQNHFYGVGWMIKDVLESATTNGNSQAKQALDKFLVVYNR